MFAFTVEVVINIQQPRDSIDERELTQDAHDVLPLSHGVQEFLVAALYRCLLRIIYLLSLRGQGVRNALQMLDLRDGHKLEKETAEPCRTEIRQIRGDFLAPWQQFVERRAET